MALPLCKSNAVSHVVVCDRILVVRFVVVVRTRILTIAPASGSVELSGLLGLLHEDSSQRVPDHPDVPLQRPALSSKKTSSESKPSPFLQATLARPWVEKIRILVRSHVCHGL